jgi:hypothetical protein
VLAPVSLTPGCSTCASPRDAAAALTRNAAAPTATAWEHGYGRGSQRSAALPCVVRGFMLGLALRVHPWALATQGTVGRTQRSPRCMRHACYAALASILGRHARTVRTSHQIGFASDACHSYGSWNYVACWPRTAAPPRRQMRRRRLWRLHNGLSPQHGPSKAPAEAWRSVAKCTG